MVLVWDDTSDVNVVLVWDDTSDVNVVLVWGDTSDVRVVLVWGDTSDVRVVLVWGDTSDVRVVLVRALSVTSCEGSKTVGTEGRELPRAMVGRLTFCKVVATSTVPDLNVRVSAVTEVTSDDRGPKAMTFSTKVPYKGPALIANTIPNSQCGTGVSCSQKKNRGFGELTTNDTFNTSRSAVMYC